jgi:hypothetical protein
MLRDLVPTLAQHAATPAAVTGDASNLGQYPISYGRLLELADGAPGGITKIARAKRIVSYEPGGGLVGARANSEV